MSNPKLSKEKRMTVRLNQYEMGLLVDLEAVGFRPLDAIRAGVRLLHRKEMPPYINNRENHKLRSAMSQEDKCKAKGGVVKEDEKESGRMICSIMRGEIEFTEPLDEL